MNVQTNPRYKAAALLKKSKCLQRNVKKSVLLPNKDDSIKIYVVKNKKIMDGQTCYASNEKKITYQYRNLFSSITNRLTDQVICILDALW